MTTADWWANGLRRVLRQQRGPVTPSREYGADPVGPTDPEAVPPQWPDDDFDDQMGDIPAHAAEVEVTISTHRVADEQISVCVRCVR